METLASVKNEQNISLVKKAFADFLSGNIAGILDASTEDIVWASYDNPTVPYAGSYKGKKGVAAFFADLAANVDYSVFDTREFYAAEDRVFVKGYQEGKIKSTGKTFGHEFLMEFRLRDGKACSFFAFVDTLDQAKAFK